MKKAVAALWICVAALLFAGCAQMDVVQKYGRVSFDRLLEAFPYLEDGLSPEGYYALGVDTGAQLFVSQNYADTGDRDLLLSLYMEPFADAGLDPSKLPPGYRAEGDMLYLGADFGEGSGDLDTMGDALFESVKLKRKALSYHEELDHFGIGFSGGKVEFAKDYETNDKDLVFVLEAAPLAGMGVDVRNVDGWTFVTMKDPDGSETDVLLRFYDLEETTWRCCGV